MIARDSGYTYRDLAIRVGESWYSDSGYDLESDETVTAWQPLPDLWDGDKANKDSNPQTGKKHVLQTILPRKSDSGENEQNWHNCDHMSSGGGN